MCIGKIRGNLVIATAAPRQQTAGIHPESCTMDATRTVARLIYPDVMSLDVTGPMQVFASANVERQRQGLPRHYELMLLAASVGPVATSAGLKLVRSEEQTSELQSLMRISYAVFCLKTQTHTYIT